MPPGRRGGWRRWPLRLGLLVVNQTLHAATAAERWLKYKLEVARWYRPRPDDVFIASFPKSGTTLMQMICYQLCTDGSMDLPHIYAVSPWFEMELVRHFPQRFEALPSPRFFKTHRPHDSLPRGARFIYLVRDPADVAVSAYHHSCLHSGMTQDRAAFLDGFFADRAQLGSWFRHTASWWPHRHDENVLFLRYEEVTADLEGTVRRVAAFCGLPIDEAQMPRILERCGLGFMRQHQDKFDPRVRRFSGESEKFVREGRSGAGAQVLSPAQEKQLARRLEELARDLGCAVTDLPPAPRARSAGDGLSAPRTPGP